MTTALTTFEAGAERARDLRDALGRFTTGVTVVTVDSAQGPVAITANSFASVSLDPPLVLWSPSRTSNRYRFFAEATHFAIHVLGGDQDELCWRIAKDAHGLLPHEIVRNPEGVPVLSDCLARFECRRWASYDGGDHEITVGRVLRVGRRATGDGLAFFAGRMTRVSATPLSA